MAVNSVSSNSSAVDAAKQASDAQRAAANQAAQSRRQQEAQSQNKQQARHSQQSKPVVNTSGQVTGQHVNTKA